MPKQVKRGTQATVIKAVIRKEKQRLVDALDLMVVYCGDCGSWPDDKSDGCDSCKPLRAIFKEAK